MTVVARASIEAIVRNRVELACVRIMREDIAGVYDGLLFTVIQRPQECRYVVVEVLRIVAINEDRVCEPAFIEIPCTLDSNCIVGGIG